jgi:hypothetical protein
VCNEGSFLALLLKGEMGAIEQLVEHVLTIPAQGKIEYRPLVDRVLLLVGSFGKIGSEAAGFGNWGSVKETHLSMWLPVAAGSSVAGMFVPDHLALAIPYMFVDNPLSYAGGREDYGYPKAMGRFTPENGSGEKVELEVFGGDFGQNKQAGWVHLLTIEREQASAQPHAIAAGGAWQPGNELVPYIEEVNGGASPDLAQGFSVSDVVTKLLAGAIRQVSLKQLRDAGTADVACYQAIVEAKVQAENVDWRRPAGTWKVDIATIASHPIGEDLGMAASQPASFALEVEFDATIKPGTAVAP